MGTRQGLVYGRIKWRRTSRQKSEIKDGRSVQFMLCTAIGEITMVYSVDFQVRSLIVKGISFSPQNRNTAIVRIWSLRND